MIVHAVLIALGLTHITYFGGHWLRIDFNPVKVMVHRVDFEHYLHFVLGSLYTVAGAVGA